MADDYGIQAAGLPPARAHAHRHRTPPGGRPRPIARLLRPRARIRRCARRIRSAPRLAPRAAITRSSSWSNAPACSRCRAAACSGSITSPSCCRIGLRSGASPRTSATLGIHAGSADHAVSEAIYLSDPDGLGIEVYADRPRAAWRIDSTRQLFMTTAPLDVRGVIAAAGGAPWTGMPAGHDDRPCPLARRRPCRRRGLLPPRARLRQSRLELPRRAVPLGGRLPPSPRRQHMVAPARLPMSGMHGCCRGTSSCRAAPMRKRQREAWLPPATHQRWRRRRGPSPITGARRSASSSKIRRHTHRKKGRVMNTVSTPVRTYQIDKAHSEATFQVRHLLSKVRGRFSDFSRHDPVRRGRARALLRRLHHPCREHRHERGRSRQASSFGRFLRQRDLSHADVQELFGHGARGRTLRCRRHADDPRHQQGHHDPRDLPRNGARPMGPRARRIRGRGRPSIARTSA